MSTAALVGALEGAGPVVAVELRPPRSGLATEAGMDAWIDLNHAVRRLTRDGRFVLLTDDAVGDAEEENLGHLEANLAEGADASRLLPFLTCKHSLEYCLLYAERARSMGLEALAVLGGDPHVGPPRCVPHAYQLRRKIAARVPELTLAGWANPHADPDQQADYLAADDLHASFYLTQVVSHESAARLEALTRRVRARRPGLRGLAGVFHYRSANPATLRRLGAFFPVPAAALARHFDAGGSPEDWTARSVRAALDAGADGVYLSNLGLRRAPRLLARILERV